MERFVAGDIVLVRFPFDDLSTSKVRPAMILCDSWPKSYMVAAITSQKKRIMQGAIEITGQSVASGTMRINSYIRPDVLFTAHSKIINRKVARLTPSIYSQIVDSICKRFEYE